ncbi:TPA: hypothetical protein HH295_01635 [Xanthomonas vasicola pv. zeae]|uniref:Uncharacterized protein n=2 Tax=Xanthomonas vasicola pv. vasculorum TaxID=325776 RepID=A0A836P315_XANVA|nr:hypothetical protein C7V42_10320 [Xanthomonas vasicola pv. vasculorum]AZR31155.1 hypothetical protein KWO_012060 [Xanthomonas vasicola pv. musacearum NCPPB 4379]KEZ95134.1 hypothetical protein A11M_0122930 [Xanthomonas vasicola pv. vasculorum NCPPB 895]KFA06610.1 hypothetical protein KWQ_0117850 [Xanthomonas vasicola pv. musacearum NCPPB 4380]KFA11615.1 hypothetical protein KWM_0106065 [Xanthomonas vasicola pv. musacearum NCPPB 2005]KFA21694.1 hypothetical protein KWU_0112495 [Xanthomonas v
MCDADMWWRSLSQKGTRAQRNTRQMPGEPVATNQLLRARLTGNRNSVRPLQVAKQSSATATKIVAMRGDRSCRMSGRLMLLPCSFFGR